MSLGSATVDVVIPVYNNWPALRALVDPMKEWIEGSRGVSIVVVDDGSSTKCDEVLSQLDVMPQVSVVRHFHNKGRSSAINTGCQYGKADYIAILDVDCVPDRQWLEAFYQNLKEESDCVFGNLRASGVGFWSRYLNDIYENRENAYINGSLDFVTAFCMLKRRVYESVGGFSEEYKKYGFEDRDFVQRIAAKESFGLRFVREIYAVHGAPKNIDGVLKKSLDSGVSSSEVFSKRFPGFYRRTEYWYFDARQHTVLYCLPLFLLSTIAGRDFCLVKKLLALEKLPYFFWKSLVKVSSALAFFQGTYISKINKGN